MEQPPAGATGAPKGRSRRRPKRTEGGGTEDANNTTTSQKSRRGKPRTRRQRAKQAADGAAASVVSVLRQPGSIRQRRKQHPPKARSKPPTEEGGENGAAGGVEEETAAQTPAPGTRSMAPGVKPPSNQTVIKFQPTALRAAPPEQTSCQTEHIAAIKRLQDLGRIETTFEDMKQAAKTFAVQAAQLTALGAIRDYLNYIRSYVPDGTTRENFDRNVARNRYKDVLCADRERVVLAPSGPGMPDYIHANHVRGPPLNPEQHFICTQARTAVSSLLKPLRLQGPTAATTPDFWRMVRQENVQAIVMLCETRELGKEKCSQYWPLYDDEVMRFDAIGLSVVNRGRFVHSPGVVTSVLEVRDAKHADREPLTVFHHQMEDVARPRGARPRRRRPPAAPVGARLSAEVGGRHPLLGGHRPHGNRSFSPSLLPRALQVMAAEMGIQALIANRPLDMIALVRTLRQKRMHCIQTDLQFVFLYKVLLSFIETREPDPETSKALEDFLQGYTSMVQNAKLQELGLPVPYAE
ncbi:Receptor-type tyrosine-protein phosphatase S [Aphelenchoides fujianensis]|nr:Receptor-type tyrosine-protein phosphatase S [Aphelenchoides fujianensis]